VFIIQLEGGNRFFEFVLETWNV